MQQCEFACAQSRNRLQTMSIAVPQQALSIAVTPEAMPIAVIVDAGGMSALTTAASARECLAANAFCWLDIFGGDDTERKALLAQVGLEEPDLVWAQRFGQAGRLAIGQNKVRAVTWMAEPAGKLIEVHLLCSRQRILTVWKGDMAILDNLRQHFVERIGEVGKSPFQATGILLQLLLSTLDHAIRRLDAQLDLLRTQLDDRTSSADYARFASQHKELQTAWLGFNRYASAVRTSMVGVEAVPGMDPRGAEELNDYAEQVEDVQEQLQERRRWMSDIVHDAANAVTQRQGEQINRLTLVSLIFLPVTAVTGFFGMNFNWMISALESKGAFFALGMLLPISMMLLTLAWFTQRGFIQIGRRRPAPPPENDARKTDG
jgi:Mg2+ and Co2+ transporter CorA